MSWLVVGLGNPGREYAKTRHNVGFMVVDEIASRAGTNFSAPRSMHADIATGRVGSQRLVPVGGESLLLAKPRTYMNESGQAVRKLVDFYHLSGDNIIVVHDELDLEPGRIRLKKGGGDNGHNGLKSIRAHLSTGDFYRVRLGIGRPDGHRAGADYVLGRFSVKESEELALDVGRGADAVLELITAGLSQAQNHFNN